MEELELRLFGFTDPHPNEWKVKTMSKAVLLQSVGRLTPQVVAELQTEYQQWVTNKAAEKGTLKDG